MAPNLSSKRKMNVGPSISSSPSRRSTSQFVDDDDFQDYPSSFCSAPKTGVLPHPIQPCSSSSIHQPSKKLAKLNPITLEKGKGILFENADWDYGLDSIEPTLDLLCPKGDGDILGYVNSTEPELPMSHDEEGGEFCEESSLGRGSTQLDVLLKLCTDVDGRGIDSNEGALGFLEDDKLGGSICCPICGADISKLSDGLRAIHTNECLDKMDLSNDVPIHGDETGAHHCPGQVVDVSPLKSAGKVINVSPVVEWLRNLGLSKYENIFVKEEIDWDTLQLLTEEELCNIGITALGPRKKVVHALKELHGSTGAVEPITNTSKLVAEETRHATNKLITDYFSDPFSERKKGGTNFNEQNNLKKNQAKPNCRSIQGKGARNGRQKETPLWCCIPGTSFRVDAFKYLRRDCSHWFLTHFHLDHYQGLTKSFCHGTIYCSSITAKLVKLKLGIPLDKIKILPLNQKINIAGTNVTCFDANHCPGAIIILFEPPNGKPVLHTGDFRFCEEMKKLYLLEVLPIHTLILDTTYCDSQYDFPKQEAVIQFVIESIQAEAFNPKTLFLIGSYTIGKERLFLEVARVLRKKIYVTKTKLRILECLDLQHEDMQWLTSNEQESHIHVVPMWTIANFKRMKHMSNQYMGRFSLIVAFSPTGWSFGKGKKSTGRRWQQGTIIRYEVPYSEHSSFTELKEFVNFISPANIIPSVNNNSLASHNSMVSTLLS